MNALDYIINKYNLSLGSSPIIIPNFNRFDIPSLFNDLGYKTGAEIGVRRGGFSLALCQSIPGLNLLCVDPWHVYNTTPRLPSQKMQDANYEITKENLKSYNARLIKKLSMEAVGDVELESLDFVYIDGHHGYEYVKDDIEEWGKRVRPGGIISGDDYVIGEKEMGVVRAVDSYLEAHHIHNWFLTQGRRGRNSSYFWVKP